LKKPSTKTRKTDKAKEICEENIEAIVVYFPHEDVTLKKISFSQKLPRKFLYKK